MTYEDNDVTHEDSDMTYEDNELTGSQPEESFLDASPDETAVSVLSASSLTGDPIVNLAGDSLGTLKELMIDVDSGTVAYLVLSRGGVMGMGEKLFALPWTLISVDGENKQLILDLDEATLEDSPGFDPDNWPAFNDMEWGSELHRHYGIDPYWETTPLT